jgi:hypothetical protein
MKFGEMKIHTTFDDKGGMTETEKKGGLFETGSERVTVTDKDGGKMETVTEKGLFGARRERLTVTTEDMAAMQKFADAETNKLSNVVEQSPDPEKGKKINRFKKALKGLTVGVTLMAATLGGFNNARATNIGDFVKKDSTSEQTITSQHENIKGLEKLKKENAKLEIARDELEKNAMELASIDQSVVLGEDSYENLMQKGLLWPESYDKYVKLGEQLRAEADAAQEQNIQQKTEKYKKIITAIEQQRKNDPKNTEEILELVRRLKKMDMASDKIIKSNNIAAFTDALEKGLISQESYDEYVELREQLNAEVFRARVHKQQKEEYEMRGNVLKDHEVRAQKVGHLAEQKTVEDAQEYNKFLNYEVDMLLNIIVNL